MPLQATLTIERVEDLRRQIQTLYRAWDQPWIVGLSQGRDSTTCGQIVWEAVRELPVDQRTRTIHYVMGDTQTETHQVEERIGRTARLIERAAARDRMPIKVHVARPHVAESLLVMIIGKGYASPTVKNRWCIDRVKLRPISRVVRGITGVNGRAVQVLGSRREESANRAASIDKYKIEGFGFRIDDRVYRFSNGTHEGVTVWTPIEAWTADDCWTYLQLFPSHLHPQYNKELRALYAAASGGECPLIVSPSSPACGSGRFGCWNCTVAHRNRSLEALCLDPNYSWMAVLWEVFSFLRLTTEPEHKPIYRDPKRNKDGTVKPLTRDTGRWTPGRYKRSVRELILTLILDAQRELRRFGPDAELTLLNQDQVRAIRYLWWEEDVLAAVNAMVRRELQLTAMEIGPCGLPAYTVPFLVNSIGPGLPEITVPGRSFRAIADALGAPLHGMQKALRARVQELAAVATQAYYPDPVPALYLARTGEQLLCADHPSQDADVLYTIEPEGPSTVEQMFMDLSA